MHKLMRYIKGYEKQALLAPLFKMLEACFELFVPLVIASIIDTGIKNEDAAFIWTRCGLLVLLAAIGLASSLTAQWFSAKAALGFGTALRKDLFRHIGTLSYSELDGIGTPTLVTRMTSDINQVQNGVNLTLRLLLRSPFIVIGALIMAFSISPKLTLLFIGVTIMVSLIIWAIMRVTVPIYHEAQNGLDRVTLLTRENYVGARVVRAFARQADELAAFVETNDHLKNLQFAAGRISALMNPLTYLVVNLAVVALLLRGGVEVDAGKLTQGEVIALINYMSQILLSLLRLADLVVSVTRALASGMRVNEILNTHTTMQDPGTAELAVNDAAEAAKFEHVTFTYKDAGAPSLTDITFTARPGETIGVIGGTGSGKSTLIDLVCRFYDADNGGVALFGHDVKQYSFAQLRRLVGVVPQQAVLFTGTIRDNMQWAAPGASDEEIWQALPHDGESIMVAPWPQADAALDFSADESDFEMIMQVIRAIRARRGEMNVPPSKKTRLFIMTAHKAVFEQGRPFFARLAFASDVELGDSYDADGSVQVVTDAARVFIPMDELVDREKELARLGREKAACEKDIAALSSKLDNPGFVAKAPAQVVDGERAKLAKARERLAKIEESIAAFS